MSHTVTCLPEIVTTPRRKERSNRVAAPSIAWTFAPRHRVVVLSGIEVRVCRHHGQRFGPRRIFAQRRWRASSAPKTHSISHGWWRSRNCSGAIGASRWGSIEGSPRAALRVHYGVSSVRFYQLVSPKRLRACFFDCRELPCHPAPRGTTVARRIRPTSPSSFDSDHPARPRG